MGNSFLLIIVGLLLFYLVISNKWACVEGALACMIGKSNQPTTTGTPTNGGATIAPASAWPALIKPPTTQTLTSLQNMVVGGNFGI